MKLTIRQIEKTIEASGGFISGAAKRLGISCSALSQRIKASPKLQAILEEVVESRLDFAESKLLENIREGKEASIFFYLKCKGKHRGYIEKQEIKHEGSIEGPPELTIVLNKAGSD